MNLGLKGKIESIHRELQVIRAGNLLPKESKGSEVFMKVGKKDISFLEYLTAAFPEGCGKGGEFDIQHLYNELGVNPNLMTVSQLIDLDQDSRWLVPEIFRDAIRKGLRTSPFYNKLVIGNETVAQPQVNMPYIDLSDAEPVETEEAESASKGTISYGNKTVKIMKQTMGIDITYEAIQYTSINLLTIFIQDIGIKLGQKLNTALINILINGDQEDGSESAAVVGVNNTTTGVLYKDFLYGWIRGSRLGRQYSSIIAGEVMANKILELSEFKQKQQGTPLQNIVVNETLPNQSQLYVSAQVPASKMIALDPKFAAVQLTSAPLLVEGDKLVSKQIQETVASITTGFANVFRDARYILDESLVNAYDGATNDFPSYMTPTL